MSKQIEKNEFSNFVLSLDKSLENDVNFLYDVYLNIFEGIGELTDNSTLPSSISIDSITLIYYLIGEFLYTTQGMDKENKDKTINDDKYVETLSNVVADKYLSLDLYNHREEKLTNKFLPPISSLELYINLMLNILSSYERNNPNATLIVDLLTKSLSISRCTLNLLCEGYETEALTMWRTLHESECILILLRKCGDVAINAYLKHMEYGLMYKDMIADKDHQNALFAQMKEEMNKIGLKSKDIKKYIEYGWLLAIEDSKNIEDFKLNFRDGLENLAGLHRYSQTYMTSSEILHSTPLLIYSNKRYFYYLTILNLYESFFRIEEVFTALFFSRINEEARNKYLEMRKMYFSQLLQIHQRELIVFQTISKK